MARNKKVTKAVRARMAATGENYTTARTRLLEVGDPARPPRFRALEVVDVEPGTGARVEPWRTLRVAYVIRRDGCVLDETGDRPKACALEPEHEGWMSALVGLRVGGLRRIEAEFDRFGRCSIEARVLSVEPYVPRWGAQLASAQGPRVERGDGVRARWAIHLRDQELTQVASSGPAGVVFTVGAGEVDPDLDRLVIGLHAGASGRALIEPRAPGGCGSRFSRCTLG